MTNPGNDDAQPAELDLDLDPETVHDLDLEAEREDVRGGARTECTKPLTGC